MKYRTDAERRALGMVYRLTDGFDPGAAVQTDKDGAYVDPSSSEFRAALMQHRKLRRENAEKE